MEGGANRATSALNLNFSEWAYDDNEIFSSLMKPETSTKEGDGVLIVIELLICLIFHSLITRSIEITQVQRLQMKVHKYLHEQFEVLNSPA
ncbi:unnamed protein product [Brassica oleracea]